MERMRRITQGRLSEILGDKTVAIDKFFRTVGISRTVERAMPSIDTKSLEIL